MLYLARAGLFIFVYFVFLVYFLLFAFSSQTTSASDCLERLVSKIGAGRKTLHVYSLTHSLEYRTRLL